MSNEIRYGELERRAYVSYHQDGLIDIIIGLGLVFFGFFLETGSSGLAFVTLMPILFYVPLKNQVTLPRLGYARFSPKRSAPWNIILPVAIALLVVLVSGILVLVFADSIPLTAAAWLGNAHIVVFGLVGAILFAGVAMLTGISRLYVYALSSLLIVSGGGLLGISLGATVATLGIVSILVGIGMLVRFLRRFEAVEVNHVAE